MIARPDVNMAQIAQLTLSAYHIQGYCQPLQSLRPT